MFLNLIIRILCERCDLMLSVCYQNLVVTKDVLLHRETLDSNLIYAEVNGLVSVCPDLCVHNHRLVESDALLLRVDF